MMYSVYILLETGILSFFGCYVVGYEAFPRLRTSTPYVSDRGSSHKRHEKHWVPLHIGSHSDNKNNDKETIDLDENVFDVALEYNPDSQQGKHGEETRETRAHDYIKENNRQRDNTEIQIDEDFTHKHPVSEKETTRRNETDILLDDETAQKLIQQYQEMVNNDIRAHSVTETSNATLEGYNDDEDLMAGSGSGDIKIENATGMYLTTSANDSFGGEVVTETQAKPNLPPYCEEHEEAVWATWSPWLQLGDKDVRFRRCHDSKDLKTSMDGCFGDFFESRPCVRTDIHMCRKEDGQLTEQFSRKCYGFDLHDLGKIDALEDPHDKQDECEYTLYDVKYEMAIGNTIGTNELFQADQNLWCQNKDKYMPFYTPKKRCQENLKALCNTNEVCKYANTDSGEEGKVYSKSACWKNFVMGGKLPKGIPGFKGLQMVCQRFDRDGKFGKAFGHKQAHYATIYDTKKRLPLMSMVKVRSLGDDKWPDIPYMIERGFIQEEISVISWFFKKKQKGITSIEDLTSDCQVPVCKFGRKQALPSDFYNTRYELLPLMSPDIIGNELGQRVAALTMTNVVAMEPTVFSSWKRVLKAVRKFAIGTCHVPFKEKLAADEVLQDNVPDVPEMHLLAGSVAPLRTILLIGNDVTVPEIIWMAACCKRGDYFSSFGIYVYNQYGQSPAIVSIENLQVLLQSMYYDNVEKTKIDLFPAFNSSCSELRNDASLDVIIP